MRFYYRSHRRKKLENPISLKPWLMTITLIALILVALPACTSLSDLCWKANANKTCPSILIADQ